MHESLDNSLPTFNHSIIFQKLHSQAVSQLIKSNFNVLRANAMSGFTKFRKYYEIQVDPEFA